MSIPALGSKVPRRDGGLSRRLGRAVFEKMGWRFEGAMPDLPKFVVIAAPHTSNWDFIVAMSAMLALDIDARWMGKHTLFRWPFTGFMRWFGGLPVNRAAAKGLVEQMVEEFEERDQLVLGIAPEGTRKRVEQWKTGFYRIAHEAGVPIVPVTMDFGRKQVAIGPPHYTTGDREADLRALYDFYEGVEGKNPERFVVPA